MCETVVISWIREQLHTCGILLVARHGASCFSTEGAKTLAEFLASAQVEIFEPRQEGMPLRHRMMGRMATPRSIVVPLTSVLRLPHQRLHRSRHRCIATFVYRRHLHGHGLTGG